VRFLRNEMEVDIVPKQPIKMKFPEAMAVEIKQSAQLLHDRLRMVPRHTTDVTSVPKSADGVIDVSARFLIDNARDNLSAAIRAYLSACKVHEILTAGQDTTHA
jgi:hypothetical protein